jgi:hypothetical protein
MDCGWRGAAAWPGRTAPAAQSETNSAAEAARIRGMAMTARGGRPLG